MGDSSAPAPQDPNAAAATQGEYNLKTAVQQRGLNSTNQVTPYGNLTYTETGRFSDGTPQMTATTSLSPEQQELYRLNTETQKGIGQIGVDQTKRIADLLSTPVSLDNDATESRLLELGRKRLDPMLDRRRQQVETQLYNQGARPGMPAWDEAMASLGRDENDARDQLILGGRSQAVQERLTERNQPLNEILALLRGSGVQQPTFVNTPQTNVQPVDYLGAVNNAYQGQMAGYQADQAKQAALYGALGSAAGTAMGGWGMSGFKKPGFMTA